MDKFSIWQIQTKLTSLTVSVHKQLVQYLLCQNNLFPHLQSAYRRSHSTETAPFNVFTEIINSIDTGDSRTLVILGLQCGIPTQSITKFCIKSYHHPWAFQVLYIIGYHHISPVELNMSITLISVLILVMSCLEFRKDQCSTSLLFVLYTTEFRKYHR